MDENLFIERMVQLSGMDQLQVTKLLEAFAAVISDKASNLDSVAIAKFGNFVPVKRAERIDTDAAGKRTLVPPQISLEFLASAILRAQIKQD